MSTLEDLDDIEREGKRDGDDKDEKKPDGSGDAEMKEADGEKKEDEDKEDEEMIDLDILNSSTRDIVTRRRLLENDTRINRSEYQRLQHEKQTMHEKIKDNMDKIENNRYVTVTIGEHQDAPVEFLGLIIHSQAITISCWQCGRDP